MNNNALKLTFPSGLETILTREFNAPRDLVFNVWTTPEHVKNWYGLRSSTMIVCEIDLRVGGAWRYVLQAPDGKQHGHSGVYKDITSPVSLVYSEMYEPLPDMDYLVTTTFTENNGKTQLQSHLLYKSQEHRDGHIQAGMEFGMNQTLNRLEELLNSRTAQ